ncbi:MAG: hypothetical protein HYV09_24045 [Deltaproteobacteria bacterium]|nr:hypothetical protein [Deltaproteobacteria bacterium]
MKKATGRWVLAPNMRRLYAWPAFRAVHWLTTKNPTGEGAELLIACRTPGAEA